MAERSGRAVVAAVALLVAVGQLLAGAAPADAAARRLAYVCFQGGNGAICTVDEDGSHATVLLADAVDDRDPTWSPDGQQIVFNRAGDLAVMKADGSGLRTLLSKVYPGRSSWSPDGSLIAFSDLGRLSVIRPDGTGRRQLSGGSGGQVQWSPDGRSLVYQTVEHTCTDLDDQQDFLLGVHTLDVATGATALVSPKQTYTGSSATTFTSGAWTPGSSDPAKIVYDGEEFSTGVDDEGVYRCYFSKGEPKVYVGGVARLVGSAPALSPDGARLAYWRRPDGFKVYVADRSGTGARVLGAGLTPSWRPTGSVTKPACANGKDDDGDGKTDYPADKGCSSAADTDESGPPTVATSLTLNYANGSTIRANGQMTPKVSPGHVDVTLLAQKGSTWVTVATKHPTLSAQGRYVVSFARPAQWLCRLDARFPGDDRYLPSTQSKTFSC